MSRRGNCHDNAVTELKPLDDQRKPSEEDLISAANSLAEFDSGLDEFSEYRDI